jgi:hypothetical protein
MSTILAINNITLAYEIKIGKGKDLPQQAEVAQGVPGRLRPRIFLKFGTTRVVGRQPYAIGTHFQGLSRPQGGTTEKIPSDTTGNRSRNRPTSCAVP